MDNFNYIKIKKACSLKAPERQSEKNIFPGMGKYICNTYFDKILIWNI